MGFENWVPPFCQFSIMNLYELSCLKKFWTIQQCVIFRVYPLFWINHIMFFFKPCKIVDLAEVLPSSGDQWGAAEDREMSEMGVSSFTQGGSPIHLSIFGWDFSQAKLDLLQGGVLRLQPWCFAAKPCIEIRDDSKIPIYWKAKPIGKTCSTRIFLIQGFSWIPMGPGEVQQAVVKQSPLLRSVNSPVRKRWAKLWLSISIHHIP